MTTLIVVSYNKRPYTQACLQSLLDSHARAQPGPCEIIVVDNGSEDGTREVLAQIGQRAETLGIGFTVIQNETNAGAPTARNQALEQAQGEQIAFLDNDVIVRSANWLPTLRTRLEGEPRIGIVGPKLVFPFEPFAVECAGCAISRSGRVQYVGRGEPRDAPQYNEAREVQCLTSAVWLMKRELYDRLGGLDEIYNPLQYEDLDFCYRAREAGYQVWYEPAAEMYHFENTTGARSPDVNFPYVTIKNGLEFKRRWRHMFEQEDGPPEEATRWRELQMRTIEETGIPPMVA